MESMTETITYSLKAGENNSDEYYQTIAEFTDEVLETSQKETGWIISNLNNNANAIKDAYPGEQELLLLELLSLGVLWKTYMPDALASRPGERGLITWFVRLREINQALKVISDRLRGWLVGMISLLRKRQSYSATLSMESLRLLLDWLTSSGEFKEEVKRLASWKEHLEGMDEETRERVLRKALDLADWFEATSLERLGKFTINVEPFLANQHKRYRWREDYHFTGRHRVEYHMNMVATELLNRHLRDKFRQAGKKIVIVPPCMKARKEDECEAKATPYGERCQACTPGCRVNQVTHLGEKHGFEVFIIPDELELFADEPGKDKSSGKIGLVGVSCPLTNASGGWEMERLGVPAQGLLLDYCGCRYHWHKQGIPTDINFDQLLRLVQEEI